MPSINWAEVRSSPLKSLKIVFTATFQTFVALFRRLIPFTSRPLGLRNAIARAWLGITFVHNAKILYSEPSSHHAQKIEEPGFTTFVIPTTKPAVLWGADAVVLFEHGGGMIMGHPLQYLDTYERWVKEASKIGKKIVILALQYPLSTAEKWPAQRSHMLAFYKWVLAQGVSPSRIVMSGDSAGADLILLTLLHIRDHEPTSPMPACLALHSPWLDLTATETTNSPHYCSDFLLEYDQGAPVMNEYLRPAGTRPDTPEISALLVKDVSGLPPQLVSYSKTEILGSDSVRWVQRSRQAGGDVTEHATSGEMHTFSMGWPITGSRMQAQSDEVLLNFIFKYVK
ncbi:alpha/beta-hydrolase [Lepidopterella palustris CBS 459.81]|uniref:Alpha/beta-hydrolase n=1 Tax=Lepidopterella palustris CBS 459.81 TaxID=1314670 RepID=A0A8E2EBJ2_9PEZI|nr:alpha/beta-hydrolase [Lepidopterella palustris CBS 459.81]